MVDVRRQGHRHPERPAARRRRDGAAAADRDDLLVLLAAGLAHQGGGHARGRPARGDRGLRPHRGRARSSWRPPGTCRRASERARRAAGVPRGVEPLLRRAAARRARARARPTSRACRSRPRRSCARASAASRRSGRTCARRASGSCACTSPRAPPASRWRSASPERDHEANSAVGGEAFRIAGLRPDDIVAHCLNYALYAGGIADHMAIEASGATVVPVGIGQSRRLLDLIPRLGITAIFGTLSFPAYLAGRAREAGIEPRELGLRHIVTAGEPGAGLAAVREEIERDWGATVADTFGMSDVWSTMGGACGEGEGLHLTVGDHAVLELVDPDSGDAAGARGRRDRRAGLDPPAPRGLAAAALPLGRPGRRCGPRRCACGRERAAHPDRRPPRRHAARAGGERLPAGDRRDPGRRRPAGAPLRRRRGRPDRAAAARVRGGAGAGRPATASRDGCTRRWARASPSPGWSPARCPSPSTRPESSTEPRAATRCREAVEILRRETAT